MTSLLGKPSGTVHLGCITSGRNVVTRKEGACNRYHSAVVLFLFFSHSRDLSNLDAGSSSTATRTAAAKESVKTSDNKQYVLPTHLFRAVLCFRWNFISSDKPSMSFFDPCFIKPSSSYQNQQQARHQNDDRHGPRRYKATQ